MRKPGVSTPVVMAKVRRPIELASLYDDPDTAGRDSHTSMLSFTIVKASDSTARALSIPEGAAVYAVERLRYVRNIPLALMRHEIPASIVTFTEKDLEERGLHEILRSHGAAPRIVSETIGARAATAAEARILKETRGAPLLTMERTAYDEHGRAVEHGQHLYRASLCTFEVTQATS